MTLIRGRTRLMCQTRVGQWLPRRAVSCVLMIGHMRFDLRYRPRAGYRAVASWDLTQSQAPNFARVEYER